MFSHTQAFSSFSVIDLQAAKQFYQEVLHLSVEENQMGLLQLVVGGTTVLVYPKADHVPANYTVLNFGVADIDTAVEKLVQHGVAFLHYDEPNLKTDEKGICRGQPTIAWFEDPAGNIFSLIED